MQPENDTQAVRRVLARAGITAAALTLTVGATAPAAFAHGAAAAGHGTGAGAGKADRHRGTHASGQSSDANSPRDGGSATGGGSAGQQHSSQGDTHGTSSDHGAQGNNGAGSDPAGNNGTVKIHDVEGDLSHHNVPHVDCDFWVPMWGFDANQQMTVSFAGQAPTGKDQPVTFTAPDGYTLTSTTPAGGGNDYDGELGFSTTAESLQSQLGAPQPQQGYHVKMTVATGAPGGYKYKVFWINCPATTGGETGGGTGGQTGGETGGQTGGTTGGQVGGESGGQTGGRAAGAVAGETAGQSSPGTAVLGEKVTRGSTGASAAAATATAPEAGSLPFTGAEIGGLAAAGAAALGGGAFLMAAGRRRRRVGAHRA